MANDLFPAVIIAGPPAERQVLAERLAMTRVCSEENPPCGVCRNCRKAKSGVHPDIIPADRLTEGKGTDDMIRVDTVRALRADAAVRPNEAARKVYLIDRADTMNVSAQNALLKLLEEGPAYASFLLMTDRPGALLETIRSRCVTRSAGREEQSPPADPQALAYGRLLAEGSEAERMAFLARMETAKPGRDALTSFLADLERLLDGAVVGGATGQFSCEEARLLGARLSAGELLRLAEHVRKAEEMLPFHVGAGHLLGWLGV